MGGSFFIIFVDKNNLNVYDKEDRIFGLFEGVCYFSCLIRAFRSDRPKHWFFLAYHNVVPYGDFLLHKWNLYYPPPTNLNYNFQIFSNKILSRFLTIALPGIIVGAIRSLKDDIIENFLFNAFHGGYWFCLSLFLIFAIYWSLNFFLNGFSDKAKTVVFSLIVLLLFAVRIIFTTDFYLEYFVCDSVYIDRFQIIAYMPFFLLGVIAKIEKDRFERLIRNNVVMSVALILYVIIFVCSFPKSEIFLAFLAILVLFRIFSMSENFFSSNNKFGKIMVYVGQRTLPIYLVHYFFIEGMRNLSPSFRELVQQNWFFELIIVSAIAIMICGACLAVEKVLQKFPLLHSLAFGFKLKKKA